MRRPRSIGGSAMVAALSFALGAGGQAPPAAAQDSGQERPNIVVIMSDDQTQDSIRYMARTQALIGDRGVTFPTNLTNWPLCCPSRATFLTGQYAHNHGVLGNQPPLGGYGRLDDSETLPVWLQRSGYYTAQIGKYLNGYEESATAVPPGWSEWHGSKRTYSYYGYQLLEDGQVSTYGSTDENPDDPAEPALYSTDVYTDKAVDLIERRAPGPQPFFLYLAYLAPHSGGPNPDPPERSRCHVTAKPAVRDAGRLAGEPLPQPPSFNEADVFDKPAQIRDRPLLTDEQIADATRNYRCRAESLLAVDAGVERIVDALRASGELDQTFVIYTSDNGFFHGEHRVGAGKNRVYEEAIRVPLEIRGPGIPRGETVRDLSINADLAPTILDAAGAQAGRVQDGRSLLPFAAHPKRERGRELLIEQRSSGDDEDNTANSVAYSAVRNQRYVYVENASGEIELYDLDQDPYELANQHQNPAYAEVEAALAARLGGLRDCEGEGCRTKPALKLALSRSTRRQGRSCRRPDRFAVRVRGAGAGGIELVRFRVGAKRAGHDAATPIGKRILPRLLRARHRPEIRATVELVDGRELTLQRQTRICR